jgi:DNA-directed RNA polymerase specialized sigma24 family protein
MDAEFAAFVRARQRALLRSAYLMCGDLVKAEDLVRRALVTLARSWTSARRADPDAYLRRLRYRDLVSAREDPSQVHGWVRGTDTTGMPGARGLGDADLRLEVAAAWAMLTLRQRAVLVLRCVEDRTEQETAEVLGVSIDTVRRQTRLATAGMREVLPDLLVAPGDAAALPQDLRFLLGLVSDNVPDVDLAGAAWAAVERRRRHTRLAAAAGLATVLVAGACLGVLVQRAPSTPSPSALTTVVTGAPRVVDGIQLTDSVPLSEVGRLPVLSERGVPVLPDPFGVGDRDSLPTLDAAHPCPGVVRAVILRPLSPTTFRVVLYIPGVSDAYQQVPVTLGPVGDLGGGNGHLQIGPRVISPDGHRVAFVQPGAVVALDIRDGEVVTTPLPDRTVEFGGWTAGGEWFMVRSATGQWRVDPFTSTVQPVAETVYDGTGLILAGTDQVDLVTFTPDGVPSGQRQLSAILGAATSETVTAGGDWVAGGWSAAAVTLSARGQEAIGRSAALLAARSVPLLDQRLLLLDPSDASDGTVTPLEWLSDGILVYRADSRSASWLLAWDPQDGRQWRVAQLSTAGGIGTPATLVSLSGAARPP